MGQATYDNLVTRRRRTNFDRHLSNLLGTTERPSDLERSAIPEGPNDPYGRHSHRTECLHPPDGRRDRIAADPLGQAGTSPGRAIIAAPSPTRSSWPRLNYDQDRATALPEGGGWSSWPTPLRTLTTRRQSRAEPTQDVAGPDAVDALSLDQRPVTDR
jgi:hypothetical protein